MKKKPALSANTILLRKPTLYRDPEMWNGFSFGLIPAKMYIEIT